MSDLTDRLNAIKALALRDLESTSDEQIRAEFVEDKQDPPEVARRVAASLARVVERTSASQHAMTAIDAQRSEIDRLTAERDALREQLTLAESVRAAQVAGLVEGFNVLRERVAVLEDALQRYVNHDLLTGTRGKMNEIARAALKGGS
jgi:hypothetical protein